ncbi:MAG: hypothetical protein B7Z55_12780 [Planctomycetales bacterium 12-60-4]|nr:MAG: hypothetical protein B7Z55_12780 [Planctomycetales bacterium 12-60-4]
MEAIAWGVCLRTVQATLQAAPFVFTGFCITAMLHRLLGHAHTKRLFGSNTVSSLIQSWFIGLLLPGCSLGVIQRSSPSPCRRRCSIRYQCCTD